MLSIMVGGIIFVTGMYFFRKVTAGEAFSIEKYGQTLGYVSLLAVGAYVATGAIPDFNAILIQLSEEIPEASAVATLGFSVLLGLYNKLMKSTVTSSNAPETGTVTSINEDNATVAATSPSSSGWQPDFSIIPTFPRVASGMPVVFTIDTGAGDQGQHACKEVIIDWMDGTPLQNVPITRGWAQVWHTYTYAKGMSQYAAHVFFPEFTTVDGYDGARKSFNTDGRSVTVEVQSA